MMMTRGYLMAIVAVLAMASCTGSAPSASDSGADSISIEVDSMAVAMTLKVYGTLDSQTEERSLATFVADQMFFIEDEDGRISKPAFAGDMRAFLQACARQKWNELKNDTFQPTDEDEDGEEVSLEELVEDAVSGGVWLTSYEIDFRKVYEDDSLVTWTAAYDFFVYRTAHPSYGEAGVTFRKADGTPLGHEILKDTDTEGFHRLQKEALREWLVSELGLEADTDEAISGYLYGAKDVNALPLPEQCPYLTADGVVLTYQENELVFAREPAVLLLPYEKVNAYLAQ